MHTGTQNHQGKACGRQFICDATKRVMTEERRTLLGECLRCEQRSLHGMCRAVGVRMRWLMHCIVPCFATLPDHLHGWPVASPRDVRIGRLEVEADEMGGCVQHKANKQWVWLAMDKQTRPIMAFHIGDRSHARAQQWWANVLAAYREQATFYTAQYAVDTGLIPTAQPKAITQYARKTNHIARVNNTMRQRISRLVRDTLAFSKSWRTISVPSHISYAMTTSSWLQHYLSNTTNIRGYGKAKVPPLIVEHWTDYEPENSYGHKVYYPIARGWLPSRYRRS